MGVRVGVGSRHMVGIGADSKHHQHALNAGEKQKSRQMQAGLLKKDTNDALFDYSSLNGTNIMSYTWASLDASAILM